MDDQEIAASDWTDVDLLTRDEAIKRLDDEIEETVGELAAADPTETERLDRRLDALRHIVADLRGPDH